MFPLPLNIVIIFALIIFERKEQRFQVYMNSDNGHENFRLTKRRLHSMWQYIKFSFF